MNTKTQKEIVHNLIVKGVSHETSWAEVMEEFEKLLSSHTEQVRSWKCLHCEKKTTRSNNHCNCDCHEDMQSLSTQTSDAEQVQSNYCKLHSFTGSNEDAKNCLDCQGEGK